MKYCLDTNVLIDILRGDLSIKSKFDKISDDECAITPIVLCELMKGATRQSRPEQGLDDIQEITDNLGFIPFNPDACLLFGKLHAQLHQQGRPTQEADLMIACMCIINDATLVTRNHQDFKDIPGLQMVAW